jgi:dolichyl-phosphate-mannose--protein O-mannosyl transferase
MSTSARTTVASTNATATARPLVTPLAIILLFALALRIVFLPSLGFHNDVSAFEAWTLALKDNPPWEFYAKTSFADYPPGYFVVLWILGAIYGVLGNLHLISNTDGSYFALRLLVKIPALVMDLVDTALIFAVVRRFASERIALAAAAFFAFNPASVYVSAYWGQIDSVSWGFILIALWLALRSSDDPQKTVARLVWAWATIALSILIKPQGSLVALVLLAFAFTAADATLRRRRLIGTAAGIAAGLVVTFAIVALFHGSLNPIADAAWLLERYRFGSNVYPYNTINAFNLYAMKQSFWQPDTLPLQVLGFSAGATWLWGIVLVLAATALVVARYLQARTDRAFLEAAMLVAFAFFALATRMHERYIFGAFLLAFPLIAFGRAFVWSAAVLSITTLLNLIYSFAYQTVMETHPAGVDATNLWGMGSHVIAAVNVATFFLLGYVYLGGSVSVLESFERDAAGAGARARAWFDPREGIVAMTGRDWLIAGGWALASFVVCIIWIAWPAEKIFDEIYYARAGEEYLRHVEIFEFTHPPLTKLVVTLSMMLFGGLHGLGDTAIGWRFMNVVVGAITVIVLYAFAKRLTGSTLFATVAAGMLVCDGFHFVQSRIATPEITVALFSLLTVYAFYRVWTASAARRAPVVERSRATVTVFAVLLGVGALVGAAVATAAATLGPHTRDFTYQWAAWLVAFLYVEIAFYLLARWATSSGKPFLDAMFARATIRSGSDGNPVVVSYADGSRIAYDALGHAALSLPEGDTIALAGGKRDELTERAGEGFTRTYARDGRLTYATPAGSAEFRPDGSLHAEGGATSGREMWVWVGVLAVVSACGAASKWNGLFDFFVVWLCVLAVFAQQYLRRPAVFGNPFGMPLDVIAGTMLLATGAIYTLCYVPFFTLGHNFLDMVALQTEMYNYHAHLVATHPYASSWWQWPILERPISYYYHDFRAAADANDPTKCCVAEILALPNPFVWWAGLITVPVVAVLAWFERNRGYALLVIAYFLQWLPWILSPRIAFEYHFYPNLAIIILCNAIVLQKLWHWVPQGSENSFTPRLCVGIYLGIVVWAFAFFYPVLVGQHVTWDAWHARMWIGRWII